MSKPVRPELSHLEWKLDSDVGKLLQYADDMDRWLAEEVKRLRVDVATFKTVISEQNTSIGKHQEEIADLRAENERLKESLIDKWIR